MRWWYDSEKQEILIWNTLDKDDEVKLVWDVPSPRWWFP